ncbi:carbonic anhydrase [Halanaeroarchaeum sulfurireducens]|uniref:carbonic anhydrase n=1 Tax=Halanaeroarchaeum sulfurireducens TaxID=1604004 RepID=A0A0F7PC53_9EURY|nr:carbonic anhydrase [Halanaeroarchaeum sulfurireducens]AKH96948.1 carbonic anhydrase [Halanaeroarchaeum sulfurireducens]ALG81349.1 carbonic anhydrase [Halanaeroarchaeum sulfurireducens]
MPETTLVELLERNRSHTDDMGASPFADLQDGQEAAAVSMSCSDARISQEGMFAVREPGWLFTPSTIGNQVWDYHDGEQVVDGSVLYPLVKTGTEIGAVVGHTGCGAITAALEMVKGEAEEFPPGISKWLGTLKPVIEAGLSDDRIDPDRETDLVDQLVEYNVDRQVDFLLASNDVPDTVAIYGFVYDFQGVYGDVPGRVYVVNAGGETDESTLQNRLPDRLTDHVARLL